MYFKLDLSFYMFAIIFWIRWIVKVAKKVNIDKYFETEVVDFKWVNLHNEYIIWYPLVYIFCCNFRSMFFFVAVKNCTKAYHILCSLYRSTHLESNTIVFFVLWFFCDLLCFFIISLGSNLASFWKFRGWYILLYRLRVM
jgi:hypothetical protein